MVLKLQIHMENLMCDFLCMFFQILTLRVMWRSKRPIWVVSRLFSGIPKYIAKVAVIYTLYLAMPLR